MTLQRFRAVDWPHLIAFCRAAGVRGQVRPHRSSLPASRRQTLDGPKEREGLFSFCQQQNSRGARPALVQCPIGFATCCRVWREQSSRRPGTTRAALLRRRNRGNRTASERRRHAFGRGDRDVRMRSFSLVASSHPSGGRPGSPSPGRPATGGSEPMTPPPHAHGYVAPFTLASCPTQQHTNKGPARALGRCEAPPCGKFCCCCSVRCYCMTAGWGATEVV